MSFVVFQRGKHDSGSNYLVKINNPSDVENESHKAFQKLPNLEEALITLQDIKGVDTTMGSGI